MKAYLLPHPPLILKGIGKPDEILKTKQSYKTICDEIKKENPDLVVIISPHGISYYDGFYCNQRETYEDNLANFNSNISVSVKNDSAFAKKVSDIMQNKYFSNCGDSNTNIQIHDHATIIAIELLELKNIVNISQCQGFTSLQCYELGMAINQAAKECNKKVVLIASGDMSHALKTIDSTYTYHKDGPIFDKLIQNLIIKNNVIELCTLDLEFLDNAAQCGWRSLVTLYGFLDGYKINAKINSYEAPYSVGYLCASFDGSDSNTSYYKLLKDTIYNNVVNKKKKEDSIVALARQAVETFLIYQQNMDIPATTKEELLEQKGCFVSIYRGKQLRGCIGTIMPVTKNIASEVIRNACLAATNDERFAPIILQELPELSYSVDVINEIQRVNSLKELNPKIYGIIVNCERKTGVLLPDLKGVNSVDEQVMIARKKGGIGSGDKIEIFKFTTTRHKPYDNNIKGVFQKIKNWFEK